MSKEKLIKEFQKSENDTGSVEVQIVLMTDHINKLTEHFKINPKDFGSKRGLLILVGKRRKFLKYLANNNQTKYKELIERLNIRK